MGAQVSVKEFSTRRGRGRDLSAGSLDRRDYVGMGAQVSVKEFSTRRGRGRDLSEGSLDRRVVNCFDREEDAEVSAVFLH